MVKWLQVRILFWCGLSRIGLNFSISSNLWCRLCSDDNGHFLHGNLGAPLFIEVDGVTWRWRDHVAIEVLGGIHLAVRRAYVLFESGIRLIFHVAALQRIPVGLSATSTPVPFLVLAVRVLALGPCLQIGHRFLSLKLRAIDKVCGWPFLYCPPCSVFSWRWYEFTVVHLL